MSKNEELNKEEAPKVYFKIEEKNLAELNNFLALVDAAEQKGIVDYKSAFGNLVVQLNTIIEKDE